MRSNVKIIFRAAAAAFFLMAVVPCAAAQSAEDERSGYERADDLDNAAVMLEVLGRTEQFCEARLPQAQISEDLGYLQTVFDYLSDAASQSGGLNFKAIARSASKIMKRAGRLKDSLALPAAEKDGGHGETTAPADSGQLRAALSALSAQISDAVDNPVLRGRLLDITGAVKARNELEKIVLLSRRIKISSEALDKTGQ
jgi:voltage-gated potassium channel Kch